MTNTKGENAIPAQVEKIHLIAVCGTGMGALAGMLKDSGFQVTGSDQRVYPPMSTFLSEKNIRVSNGFRAANLAHNPDLVIVGNAVSRDNPEVIAMQEKGYHYCSMPQALNHFIVGCKKRLVVTGTHGKTTTSAILSWILFCAGSDPGFFIGGILKNFNSNSRLGNGAYMVMEGDEYDTAFFDKGPKFLHYPPHRAIVTSVEFDHADIFKDITAIKGAFDLFLSNIPDGGAVLAFDADRNIDALLNGKNYPVSRYGSGENAAWRLGTIQVDPPWTTFEVDHDGVRFGRFRTRMMGAHNLQNATAAIGICHDLNIDAATIGEALETFDGVKRRQEIRGIKNGVTVIDDFAHHPTAVRETIRAIKPFARQGRLVAVFEPRTNSSMRNIFQADYALSFDAADLICIRKPPLLEKIPEKERFCSQTLVEDLKARGKDAHYFADTEGILQFLVARAKPLDTVLIMSNGGFDDIHARLLATL